MTGQTQRERNFGLDVVRAMAITLVLSNHLIGNFLGIDVGPFWFLAYLGVDIFFGLSGFLIGSILINTCEGLKGDFGLKDSFVFLARRWFRTVPLYFVLLGLNFWFGTTLLGRVHSFDYRFLYWGQNFTQYPASFFGESWSLSIEEWFYFSFSILLFIYGALTRRWTAAVSYKVAILSIGYILFFTGLRLITGPYDGSEFRIVVYRLDAIGYGVLMAALTRSNRMQPHKTLLGATGMVFIISASLLFLSRAHGSAAYILYYNMGGAGIALGVWYLGASAWVNRTRRAAIEFISRISYSIYLVNLLVIYVLQHYLARSVNGYVLCFLALVLVIVASWLTYTFIERPFLRLRDKYFPDNRHNDVGHQVRSAPVKVSAHKANAADFAGK